MGWSRRVILATGGSLGDLHPFIAMGQALQALGHEAVIATSSDYRAKIEAEGLEFREVGLGVARLEVDLGMDRQAITAAVMRSNAFLFEKIVLPNVQDATRAMIAASRDCDVIVGHSFALGARIAAECHGLPYVPVALQPMSVFSAYDPPALPAAPWLRPCTGGPALALNRLTIAASRLATARWTRDLDRARRALGAGPSPGDLLFDALRHAPLALGLYSPLLGPRQPDAPETFHVVGYAAYDSEDGQRASLAPEITAFLDAGPPPVVLTLGSAVVALPGNFYREGLRAARSLGLRAILLVGPDGDLSVADGPDVLALKYAPFSRLFPHAAAIVHQGGVGTTQQALRAGRPQVVVPHLGDQFDNARRVGRLGVGAPAARNRLTDLAGVLAAVLRDCTAQAASLAASAAAEDGASAAAEAIVTLRP